MKPHEQARAWRLSRKLSAAELSELTGYSPESIYRFESGLNGQNKPHEPRALQRYRMCCSGVDRQLRSGKGFEW